MSLEVFILDYKPYCISFEYRCPTKKSDHIWLTSFTNVLVEHMSYNLKKKIAYLSHQSTYKKIIQKNNKLKDENLQHRGGLLMF
jgi:hypothetical protein